jgi:hypothetical protein
MRAIPLTGAGSFARAARATRIVRISAIALAAAALVAAAVAGRHPHAATQRFLPQHTRSGVVVLDLSASVSSDTYARMGVVLHALATQDARYGLVVFSDVAYQVLPLGTPATHLDPIVRYFTLPTHVSRGQSINFPLNPWSATFTGGTKIAAGLAAARDLARENGVGRTPIILISDLADDDTDVTRLNGLLLAYRNEGLDLRVIPLHADPKNLAYFRRLLGPRVQILPTPPTSPESSIAVSTTRFPDGLVWFAAAALVLLGVFELLLSELTWREARA